MIFKVINFGGVLIFKKWMKSQRDEGSVFPADAGINPMRFSVNVTSIVFSKVVG